ncbi:MAG: LTA synthase family protein [Tannerella sp.]|nr:LTA synthase family protein [Tannerella sp.]
MNGGANGEVGTVDLLQILYHGLPIDMSLSGYLTILPALLIIASVWVRVKTPETVMTVYFSIMLFIIAIITSIDVILYPHWGFHLDPVVLFYLGNPGEAVASGTIREWILGILIVLVFTVLLYYGYGFSIRKLFNRLTVPRNRIYSSLILLLLTGALFLPIRGGITVSTMNVSRAYFSNRMFLNHAAINPIFNFLYLLNKNDHFESQYQFYDRDEAQQIFYGLTKKPENADRPSLLRIDRPNIILFMLESFSYDVAVDSAVAPNMARFAREGILFDRFFANSFRTDRALTSILSGYPAHPTIAVLKYPKKTERLPAFPRYLRAAGYENQTLYYGGDVNFANMRSYFVGSCGIRDIVSDRNFPVRERLTKWGVPDGPVIDRAYRDLVETKPDEPFLKVILTLSSHEPFDVPTRLFDVPFLNAVNYTDECIGRFVANLKSTGLWDNTLIIFTADHAMQSYPQGTDNYEKIRFHIPMIWTGGAVREPAIVSDYGSQNDLAATLLSQLHIDYAGFRFSKDMLQPQSHKFSFYSYVNGFCMMDTSSVFLYDNNQQKTLERTGDPAMEKEAKAFFQMMYLDLGER